MWTRNDAEKKKSSCKTSEHSLKYGSSADVNCLYSFSDLANCVCLADNFDLIWED